MPDNADMPERPSRRGGGDTVDQIVARLSADIVGGRYVPGQRLIEADVTRELGVSRGPVREAFRRLSAEGLIEIVPNRGALVRRLSFGEAMELFQIRTELEALAARLAAKRIAEPCVRAAFECATRPVWSAAPRLSAAAYVEENRQFHTAIFAAAGNAQLAALNRRMQLPLIMAQSSATMTVELIARSLAEHREIAAAILAGQTRKAEASSRRHIERAMREMRNMPDTVFRPLAVPA